MICLNPLLIPNKRMKDKWTSHDYYDDPFIFVPCGRCEACRKKHANDWRVRLTKELELGNHRSCWFITLTVDGPNYHSFVSNTSRFIRLFLERYRARYKRSLRHWFVTELGDDNGRLHIHGFVFDCRCSIREFTKLWGYGITNVQINPDLDVIGYLIKYMLKPCKYDESFYPSVFCSSGIGKQYLTPRSFRLHRTQTNPIIRVGRFIYSLPRYYFAKIFDSVNYRHFLKIQSIFNPRRRRYFFRGIFYSSYDSYATSVRLFFEDSLKRGSSFIKPICSLLKYNPYVTYA